MGKYINWCGGDLGEIEAVYKRAGKNKSAEALLEEMEKQAFAEAKANCRMFKLDNGERMSKEKFGELGDVDLETMVASLGGFAVGGLSQDLEEAVLSAEFTPDAGNLSACVFFRIINKLERLDGTVQRIADKWTLELVVPSGVKGRLAKWEMLTMMLYPWLSVRESDAAE